MQKSLNIVYVVFLVLWSHVYILQVLINLN